MNNRATSTEIKTGDVWAFDPVDPETWRLVVSVDGTYVCYRSFYSAGHAIKGEEFVQHFPHRVFHTTESNQ